MLLLADRGFYSYRLWAAAAARRTCCGGSRPDAPAGAPALPDGSWLAHVSDPAAVRRRTVRNGARRRRGSRLPPDTGPAGITVRVIEFWLTVATEDGAVRTERYRLITTLADWRRTPASWPPGTPGGGDRDRVRRVQTTARPRPHPAQPHPRPGPPGTMAYLVIYQAIRAVSPGRRAAGPGPDLLHRRPARRPPHPPRPHQPRALPTEPASSPAEPRRQAASAPRPQPSSSFPTQRHQAHHASTITIRHPPHPPTSAHAPTRTPLSSFL